MDLPSGPLTGGAARESRARHQHKATITNHFTARVHPPIFDFRPNGGETCAVPPTLEKQVNVMAKSSGCRLRQKQV